MYFRFFLFTDLAKKMFCFRSLLKLDSLQTLKISNNSLTTIENYAFDGARNLINIILAQNQLNFTNANAFDIFLSCQNLTDLNLSFNNFSVFHKEWILSSNNCNLSVLNISYNYLTNFVVSLFFHLFQIIFSFFVKFLFLY